MTDKKINVVWHGATLFEIQTNKEITEEIKKSVTAISGVEGVINSRYSLDVRTSPMFDRSKVEEETIAIIEGALHETLKPNRASKSLI